jgi:hypothetical protein
VDYLHEVYSFPALRVGGTPPTSPHSLFTCRGPAPQAPRHVRSNLLTVYSAHCTSQLQTSLSKVHDASVSGSTTLLHCIAFHLDPHLCSRGGSTQMRPHEQSDVSSDDERDSQKQNDPSRHTDGDSTDDHEEEQRPLREKGGRRRRKKVGAERFSDIALYKLRNDLWSYSRR